jgi:hypothetical protein
MSTPSVTLARPAIASKRAQQSRAHVAGLFVRQLSAGFILLGRAGRVFIVLILSGRADSVLVILIHGGGVFVLVRGGVFALALVGILALAHSATVGLL